MTRRLLGVFAHPDDESFGPGGTLAIHSAAGVDVHVATMTDGGAGAPAPGFPMGAELAEIRAGELQEAGRRLGATMHHLAYRDSGFTGDARNSDHDAFMNIDPAGPIGDLVGLIRELRPDVVITHDDTGGYFHPDHIRTFEVTRAAFFAAGDPQEFPERGMAFEPARLYSEVTSNKWIKRMVPLLRILRKDPTRMGVNRDVDITQIGVDPRVITTRIDVRAAWPMKKAAGACHVSQRGGSGVMGLVPAAILARLLPEETFVRIHPEPWPGLSEHSFFR